MIEKHLENWVAGNLPTGQDIQSIFRMSGRANSRIYCVLSDAQKKFAFKVYPRKDLDKRNRLATEAQALELLQSNGINNVPKLIAVSPENNCVLLQWIEGTHIQLVKESHILSAVDFIREINRMKFDKTQMPEASEACFSGAEIIRQINGRLERLAPIQNHCLQKFVEDKFIPFFREVSDAYVKKSNVHLPLNKNLHILSPSDFGFHNALLTEDERIFFIDFEYFGRDDASKLICDVLLHAGMQLSNLMKNLWLQATLKVFKFDTHLLNRIEIQYPLFSLKWSLLVLNEFIPEIQKIRQQANPNYLQNQKEIESNQLDKAEYYLNHAKERFNHFHI